MTKRIMDVDPFTGIETSFDYNPIDGSVIVGYEDARNSTGKVLEWNRQRAKNIGKNKLQHKRDFLHYARIPPMAQLDMLSRHGVNINDKNHQRKMMSLLNSSEYQDCRISHWKHDR